MAGGTSFDGNKNRLTSYLGRLWSGAGTSTLVLRVGLAFRERKSELSFNLMPLDASTDNLPSPWWLPAEGLGIPTRLDADIPTSLSLPPDLVAGLIKGLTELGASAGQLLWLDLLRPYGFLGVLAWERELGRELNRPILRLSDLFEWPQECPDVADVALVQDADPTAPPEKVTWQVRTIANAILRGSPRLQTRVHIFASASWVEALRKETFDQRVHVYDIPAPPSSSVEEHGGRSAAASKLSSWTDWMSRALGGRSLDAVHFVTDAELTLTGAALALPVPERRSGDSKGLPCLFAGAEHVAAATTLLGAWATVVTPACAGRGDAANALVADAIARTKPGPLLYHPVAEPDDAEALTRAYSLLLSPLSSQNIRLARGFLYSVPKQSGSALSAPAAALVEPLREAITRNSAVVAARAPIVERVLTTVSQYIPGIPNHQIEQIPNWAGAIQRYVETTSLDQLRRASNDVLLSRANTTSEADVTAARSRQTELVGKVLSQIQSAVAERIATGTQPIEPRPPSVTAKASEPEPREPEQKSTETTP